MKVVSMLDKGEKNKEKKKEGRRQKRIQLNVGDENERVRKEQ